MSEKEDQIAKILNKNKQPDDYSNYERLQLGLMKMISKQFSDIHPGTSKDEIHCKGFVKRIIATQNMRFVYSINSSKPNILAFKLYDGINHIEITYSFIIAFDIRDINKTLYESIYLDKSSRNLYGNYIFTFFNFSYSLNSCDGEYRLSLITNKSFNTLKQTYYDIINDLEEYIKVIYKKRKWSLLVQHYSSEKKENVSDIEQIVRVEGFLTLFLSFTWLIIIRENAKNSSITHMNNSFKTIFLSNLKEDLEFYNSLIEKYTETRIFHLYNLLIYIANSLTKTEGFYTKIGFKMIPLNIKEVERPFDLRFKSWREYLIGLRLNDGILNGIICNVPFTITYLFLTNAKKNIFDNKSQYEKIKNSELAVELIKELKKAQVSTYFMARKEDQYELVKEFINNKFHKLSDLIDKPINFALEEIIMTDVVFILLTENVGRTVFDILTVSFRNKELAKVLGNMFQENKYFIFAKIIFDITYGLLTLNKVFGMIHTDLHLNNATIDTLRFDKDLSDKRNTYKLNNKEYTFYGTELIGFIIDYSRCVIHKDFYEDYSDKDIIGSGISKDIDEMIEYDKNILLNVYLQLFPTKKKRKDELLVLFKKHYNALFKLLTCIDIYMFTTRMLKLLDGEPVSKKAALLIVNLNKESEVYLTTKVNNLLDNPSEYSKVIESDPYPLQELIEKNFLEFTTKNNEETSLIDYINLDNEFKYSYTDHNNLPIGIRTFDIINENGEEEHIEHLSERRKKIMNSLHEEINKDYTYVNEYSIKNRLYDEFKTID